MINFRVTHSPEARKRRFGVSVSGRMFQSWFAYGTSHPRCLLLLLGGSGSGYHSLPVQHQHCCVPPWILKDVVMHNPSPSMSMFNVATVTLTQVDGVEGSQRLASFDIWVD
eukprot:scaffold46830_cov62-Attheya_sp.AAC.4